MGVEPTTSSSPTYAMILLPVLPVPTSRSGQPYLGIGSHLSSAFVVRTGRSVMPERW